MIPWLVSYIYIRTLFHESKRSFFGPFFYVHSRLPFLRHHDSLFFQYMKRVSFPCRWFLFLRHHDSMAVMGSYSIEKAIVLFFMHTIGLVFMYTIDLFFMYVARLLFKRGMYSRLVVGYLIEKVIGLFFMYIIGRSFIYMVDLFFMCVVGLLLKEVCIYGVSWAGTAYCMWSVNSSFSHLNRRPSSLGLFRHVPLKRD